MCHALPGCPHAHFNAGALFWALEVVLDKSPVATLFFQLLMKNPKMSKAEAEKCVPMVITRIVGFIHNTIQVRLKSRIHASASCVDVFLSMH